VSKQELSVRRTRTNHADHLQTRSFRRALVIDDQTKDQDVVLAILGSAFPGLEIRFATNLEAALELQEAFSAQDLVLLEPGLRGRFGMDVLTRLRKLFPEVAVVIRSSAASRAVICAAFNSGILGYFPKTMEPQLAIAGLQFIAAGGIFVPPEVLEKSWMDAHPSHHANPALTPSQTKVLRLLLTGRSNRDIASELKIAEGTVKQHVHALYRTLGVKSRAAVIAGVARSAFEQYEIKREF
jgi:DNA-binding NarL/FixJ family response regulator